MAVNQLKAGAVLSYVIIILNSLIGLLYTPYMLRMMGKSEYGLYSLAASVVAYLTVLDLGFGNAIVRYTAKYRAEGKVREQEEMFGMFIILYSVISVVAFVLGLVLYFNVDSLFSRAMSPEEVHKVEIMMLLLTFNLAFTFPMSIWGSIITAYEDFVFQRVVSILRIVLNPLVMIILLMMGYRSIAMVVVTTIFNVLTLLLNLWYCKNKIHIKVRFGRFKWGFLKEVSIYSFWIFLNAIMDRIYWSTGQFVLGIFKGAAVVAVYAVAIQLQSMYMMFSTAISNVFLPRITAMVSQHKSEREISDLFIRTGRVQYIVMAFILTGFILFGAQFIRFWAGKGYDDAYVIALLFFIPLTVPLIQNVGISILQARNEMKFRSVLYVIIAIASVGLSVPMSKMFGGIGCAVATALALVLGHVIVMNIYYYKKIHLDIPRFWKEIGKMSIAPFIVGGFIYWTFQWVDISKLTIFVMAMIVFVLIYVPVCWKFSMNSQERNLIASPVKQIIQKLK